MGEWSLRDARKTFNKLVDAALAGEPQRITLQGQSAIVLLLEKEYERLRSLEECHVPNLCGLLVAMPLNDQDFDRPNITPRAF